MKKFIVALVAILLVSFVVAGERAQRVPLEAIEQAGRAAPGQTLAGIAFPNDSGGYSFLFEHLDRGRTSRARLLGEQRLSTICPILPNGACDSDSECESEIEKMCKNSGHKGVDKDTVQVTEHVQDNGKTCSGTCSDGSGAIGFIDCHPLAPDTIIDDPDPAGRL